MNKISPLIATVIFAAAAAALFAGVAGLPLRAAHRPAAANAVFFLCLTAYAVFLVRASGQKQWALFAPLFLLAAVLASAGSVAEFVLPAAAGLSWIRSGICFPGSIVRRVGTEALTCPAGLVLVWLLQPPGPYGWALGMWMFGLVQALYFVIFEAAPIKRNTQPDLGSRHSVHHRVLWLLQEKKLEKAFEELRLSSRCSSDT